MAPFTRAVLESSAGGRSMSSLQHTSGTHFHQAAGRFCLSTVASHWGSCISQAPASVTEPARPQYELADTVEEGGRGKALRGCRAAPEHAKIQKRQARAEANTQEVGKCCSGGTNSSTSGRTWSQGRQLAESLQRRDTKMRVSSKAAKK